MCKLLARERLILAGSFGNPLEPAETGVDPAESASTNLWLAGVYGEEREIATPTGAVAGLLLKQFVDGLDGGVDGFIGDLVRVGIVFRGV